MHSFFISFSICERQCVLFLSEANMVSLYPAMQTINYELRVI